MKTWRVKGKGTSGAPFVVTIKAKDYREVSRKVYDRYGRKPGVIVDSIVLQEDAPKNNPRFMTPRLQQRFNIDDWTAKKIGELNNEIRRLVKNGRTVAEAKRKVKSESVAGPKIWKAVDFLLKEYPPVERNPRKKTAKRKSRSHYKHEDIRPASAMAKGSIRTIKRGKKRVRIGCPKGPGHYNKKTGRCRVGTRAVSILIPNPKEKRFVIFQMRRHRVAGHLRDVFYYWNGEAFVRNYKDAERFYKENAIAIVKATHRAYPHLTLGVSDGKA